MDNSNLLARLNTAESAWLSGEDVIAERSLVSCFPSPSHEDAPFAQHLASLTLARYASHLDEPEVAASICASLVDSPSIHPLLQAWATLVAWLASTSQHDAAQVRSVRALVDRHWQPKFGVRIAVEGASTSIVRGWNDEARAWLELARRGPSPQVSQPQILRASARVALIEERMADAAEELEQAMALARAQGWKRLHGRLALEYGVELASKVGSSPMTWISRAAPDLFEVGTWRDRSTLRATLHDYGRRRADRAMSAAATKPISEIDRSIGAMRMEDLIAVHRLAQAHEANETVWLELLARTRSLSRHVSKAQADLTEIVGEALVERDRTATMVHALSALERIKEPETYANTGVRIASDLLEARRAWLVERLDDGSQRVVGSHPPGATLDEKRWKERSLHLVVTDSYDERPRRKALLGSTMAVPVETKPFQGALLLDKGAAELRFREDDRVLATLLGVQLAHGLARMRASDAMRIAHTRLEATFDAIGDGVLSVDARGCVLTANAAATRMLQMQDAGLVGACLPQVLHLRPLWQVLSTAVRVDGMVVRLAHGSVVLTSRTVEDMTRSMVVTFIEQDQAERMVHALSTVEGESEEQSF